MEVSSPQPIWSLASHPPPPRVQPTPGTNGSTQQHRRLLSGSLDGAVKVWTLTEEEGELQLVHSFEGEHQLGVTSVAMDHSGQVGVSSGLDNQVILYDLMKTKVTKKISVAAGVAFKVSLNPDGSQLVMGGQLGKVWVYTTKTGELLGVIDTLSNQFIMSLTFSPCGLFLACGTNLGLVFTLELKTMSIYRKFTVNNQPIRALAYTPAGTKLAVGSDDGRITVYDPVHQSVLGSLVGHTSWITSLQAVKEDLGEVLISGSCDTHLRYWDLTAMTCLSTLKSGYNDTSLPFQIWGLAHVPRPPQITKLVAGFESGLLKVYDQPFFKSK